MIDLTGKNVAVTGGKGFIGKYVCEALKERGANVHVVPKHLLDAVYSIGFYLDTQKIDYVMHLAGYNGGIEFNRKYPADVFHINTMLALVITNACINTRGNGSEPKVKKLLSTITSCSYPPPTTLDGKTYSLEGYGHNELELHCGPPNEVVACHGYAKRNLEIASQMCRKQHGLNAVIACPNTVYGPGDRTDPDRTKVLTALVKKFVDAKRNRTPTVVCWGTGSPKREFIYVADAAELLVRALERWEGDGNNITLNISTGQEFTIKALSELVAQKVGYTGEIIWDTSHPDGAMRKSLDITRMRQYLGDYDFVPIEKGIEETVRWYESISTT